MSLSSSSSLSSSPSLSLAETVQTCIESCVSQCQDAHTRIDVLRRLRDDTHLAYETEFLRHALLPSSALWKESLAEESDPRIQTAITKFVNQLRVLECTRWMDAERSHIRAVLQMGLPTPQSQPQLIFLYEKIDSQVRYTIDWSSHYDQPNERLLVIQVVAAGTAPSILPAQPLPWHDDDDDDDDWEDMEVEEEEGAGNVDTNEDMKSAETDIMVDETNRESHQKERKHDQFAAYLDPDVLRQFLQQTQLEVLHEGMAFFLIMSFPYYEHEWDLVGFGLDAIFGESPDDAHHHDEDEISSDEENSEETPMFKRQKATAS